MSLLPYNFKTVWFYVRDFILFSKHVIRGMTEFLFFLYELETENLTKIEIYFFPLNIKVGNL